MAYDEKVKPAPKAHSITMDDRCKLTVTGVVDVESFDETMIVMNTSQGNLVVRGSGLHIGKIALDNGDMRVEGMISELSYEAENTSGGFWSRLFG